MNARLKKLKELLAANDIELLTYRYKAGECSCCYGALHDYKGDRNWVSIDLNVASNPGLYDCMGPNKTYFNQAGKLKHDNYCSFGLSEKTEAEAKLLKSEYARKYVHLKLGAMFVQAATEAGFNVTWPVQEGACVVLNADPEPEVNADPEPEVNPLVERVAVLERKLSLAKSFVEGQAKNAEKFLA